MSKGLAEIAILEDVCTLPANMQNIYLRLIGAIDYSLQKLRNIGATPDHISEEFIEDVVNQLLDQSLSQKALEEQVSEEFMRKILEQAETCSTSS